MSLRAAMEEYKSKYPGGGMTALTAFLQKRTRDRIWYLVLSTGKSGVKTRVMSLGETSLAPGSGLSFCPTEFSLLCHLCMHGWDLLSNVSLCAQGQAPRESRGIPGIW